jgi:hypothetical protein
VVSSHYTFGFSSSMTNGVIYGWDSHSDRELWRLTFDRARPNDLGGRHGRWEGSRLRPSEQVRRVEDVTLPAAGRLDCSDVDYLENMTGLAFGVCVG